MRKGFSPTLLAGRDVPLNTLVERRSRIEFQMSRIECRPRAIATHRRKHVQRDDPPLVKKSGLRNMFRY